MRGKKCSIGHPSLNSMYFARVLMQICNSIYSSFMWEGQEGKIIVMVKMHAMFRHNAIFFDILGLTKDCRCIYFAGVKLQFILKIWRDTLLSFFKVDWYLVLKVNRFLKIELLTTSISKEFHPKLKRQARFWIEISLSMFNWKFSEIPKFHI